MSIGWLALLCAVWCIGHNQGSSYAEASADRQEEMMSHKNHRHYNYIVVLHNPYYDDDPCRLWFHEDEEPVK